MTPTSEERRTAAARLRKAVKEHLYSSSDLGESIAAEVNCYGYQREKVFTHLADLIDPTCATREYGHPDEFKVVKGCNVCGNGWYEDIVAKPYQFCPWCGARVVNRDGKKRIPSQDI